MKNKYKNLLISIILGIVLGLAMYLMYICLTIPTYENISEQITEEKQKLGY